MTGSDGKTTTTTIIAKLLEQAGYNGPPGGNIGHPLLAETFDMKPEDIAVLELSSFQLMRMETSPEIAVVTNVAPNHLDIHKDMEEYVASKKNIFLHQKPGDKVVLNRDNELTYSFATEAKGDVMLFSRQNPMESGVVLENGVICVKRDGVSRPVLPVEDILLPGVHNIETTWPPLALWKAWSAMRSSGISPRNSEAWSTASSWCGYCTGVKYYNDSIGSSPSRTIADLRAFSRR